MTILRSINMYYAITIITLFIALACGFLGAMFINKRIDKEEQL